MKADSRNEFDPEAPRRCCSCFEVRSDVKNIACLPEKAPEPGTGWGCYVCGLPPDGALALVCDKCTKSADPNEGPEIEYVYSGKIGGSELTARKWLNGRQEHDAEKHGADAA